MRDRFLIVILYPIIGYALYYMGLLNEKSYIDISEYIELSYIERIEFYFKSFFLGEDNIEYLLLYTFGVFINIGTVPMRLSKILGLSVIYFIGFFFITSYVNNSIILDYNYSYVLGSHIISLYVFLFTYGLIEDLLDFEFNLQIYLIQIFVFMLSISFIDYRLDSPMLIYSLASLVFGLLVGILYGAVLIIKNKDELLSKA